MKKNKITSKKDWNVFGLWFGEVCHILMNVLMNSDDSQCGDMQ